MLQEHQGRGSAKPRPYSCRPAYDLGLAMRLLEHSTPQLTNDVYTNVDPVLRQAVSQLPVAEWV
jgi:hypothetical protein